MCLCCSVLTLPTASAALKKRGTASSLTADRHAMPRLCSASRAFLVKKAIAAHRGKKVVLHAMLLLTGLGIVTNIQLRLTDTSFEYSVGSSLHPQNERVFRVLLLSATNSASLKDPTALTSTVAPPPNRT